MRMNVNGMGFEELIYIIDKLEKLRLSTKIDIFGEEAVLITEMDENSLERVFVELDEDSSEIIEIDHIAF
ncbi:MAG: hypothetical protein WC356_03255 [Candidatus Micrarchaeia archaeon]|jgi:hypothetical protein